jgi:hypothetical protein
MATSDRINSWLSLSANLAIFVGIVLVLIELNQNTEHLRLQLRDQINARMYENNLWVAQESARLASSPPNPEAGCPAGGPFRPGPEPVDLHRSRPCPRTWGESCTPVMDFPERHVACS